MAAFDCNYDYRSDLLAQVEEGSIHPLSLILCFAKYLGQRDLHQLMQANEILTQAELQEAIDA